MIHGKFVEVEPVITRFYQKGVNFFYFCGGRGIGKTYGALDMCFRIGNGDLVFDESGKSSKFMYLRRTAVEAESVSSPEGNAFKKYNADEGTSVCADWNSKLGFGNWYLDAEKEKHIGYIAGLSTFSNLRGVDFSDVCFILFDECIPEKKNRARIDREGILLMNMLETVNRNRGLLNQQEVVLCMLSNPIDLGSTLLSELAFTPILNNMIVKGQQRYTDYERSLHIEKYVDHVISKEKKDTALYKFSKGTKFADEALTGDFVNNDMSVVAKQNLVEFKPEISLENLFIYKHKSEERYHISIIPGNVKYEFKVFEREKFREVFYWKYKLLVIHRKVTYDNYQTKVIFEEMINYKPTIKS